MTPDPAPAGAWLGPLLQFADPLFPTGGYAHSSGLEELVRLRVVRDEPTLRAHLLGRVRASQARLELPFVRHARTAALAGDLDALERLDRAFEIRKPAAESRTAGRTLGRRRLAALRALAPHPLLTGYGERIDQDRAPGQPVAIAGLQAAVAGLPEEAALTLHYYLAGAGACSAALKLLRIGQDAIQRLLGAFVAETPGAIAESGGLDPLTTAWFDPVLDIACMRHERAEERLFIS